MDPEAFARSWLAAFNAQDLDAILAHYAEDVEHSSPTVARLLGEPTGVVRGKKALRAYFEKALAAAGPGLRYEMTRLHVGVDGVTILYDRSGGKLVAETFWLDARGLVRRAFVAHAEAPAIRQGHFVLAVPSAREAAGFFVAALGFRVVNEPPGWVFVARDGCMVMLGECPDALPPARLGDHAYFGYLLVEDADALHDHARRVAPEAVGPIEDKPWGFREFPARTPWGHRLMVGQRLR